MSDGVGPGPGPGVPTSALRICTNDYETAGRMIGPVPQGRVASARTSTAKYHPAQTVAGADRHFFGVLAQPLPFTMRRATSFRTMSTRWRITMDLINRLRALGREEAGQDLLEYALLVGLIALVAVVAVTAAGKSINGIFGAIAGALGGIPV